MHRKRVGKSCTYSGTAGETMAPKAWLRKVRIAQYLLRHEGNTSGDCNFLGVISGNELERGVCVFLPEEWQAPM